MWRGENDRRSEHLCSSSVCRGTAGNDRTARTNHRDRLVEGGGVEIKKIKEIQLLIHDEYKWLGMLNSYNEDR